MRTPLPILQPGLILLALLGLALGVFTAGCQTISSEGPPINVGLIAPMSGSSSASGEAIRRGMLLAIEEINQAGGVLGRPLRLVVRDVQNDPLAGEAALGEMVHQDQIVAVFGGIFSPVMLGQLDAVHELQIPLINTWGSVTAITKNGRQPNYAFRVSVSDEHADEFLVRYAAELLGVRRPGIIADTTAWGDSNVEGLTDWLHRLGIDPAGVERMDQGDTNMSQQLLRLRQAGADSLLMVANAPEGAAIVRGMAALGWQAPVVSHWGIGGGRFVELAGVENTEGVLTLQSFSFLAPLTPKGDTVLQAHHAQFGTRRAEEIAAPVGVAHGYDGVHLLALAIRQAGTADGPQVQHALENLPSYDGLLKHYYRPFTPESHDALVASDYIMAVWRGGKLVLAQPSSLER